MRGALQAAAKTEHEAAACSPIVLPKVPPGESVSANEFHADVTVLFGKPLAV